MDISADLVDLGRTPMAVVCAGAKSILDIPRTLEFLETQGVCVAAYQSNEFPAFFTRSSGCKAPCRIEDPQQAAGLIASSLQLGLSSGILIGKLQGCPAEPSPAYMFCVNDVVEKTYRTP